MVNTEDFIVRIEKILDYYSLSASAFADKISVQRSSLSHLLSGRNKPSLDFILKIVDEFPEVDLYWIIQGKGTFPKQENIIIQQPVTKSEPIINTNAAIKNPLDLFTNVPSTEKKEEFQRQQIPIDPQNNTLSSDEIERIVIFFKNGTFKHYNS